MTARMVLVKAAEVNAALESLAKPSERLVAVIQVSKAEPHPKASEGGAFASVPIIVDYRELYFEGKK